MEEVGKVTVHTLKVQNIYEQISFWILFSFIHYVFILSYLLQLMPNFRKFIYVLQLFD